MKGVKDEEEVKIKGERYMQVCTGRAWVKVQLKKTKITWIT